MSKVVKGPGNGSMFFVLSKGETKNFSWIFLSLAILTSSCHLSYGYQSVKIGAL